MGGRQRERGREREREREREMLKVFSIYFTHTSTHVNPRTRILSLFPRSHSALSFSFLSLHILGLNILSQTPSPSLAPLPQTLSLFHSSPTSCCIKTFIVKSGLGRTIVVIIIVVVVAVVDLINFGEKFLIEIRNSAGKKKSFFPQKNHFCHDCLFYLS